MNSFTHCYVDESIHDSIGIVVIAFIFTNECFANAVTNTLKKAGLKPPREEFKSSARMDVNKCMQEARAGLLSLAALNSKIAVFFGPFHRPHLGKQTLQALQSILVRNAISPSSLSVYFDEGIFPSTTEATRLHNLFYYLKDCTILAREDSHICVGIQVADAVAHSFGQVIKEALTGSPKMIDISGPDTGYAKGTKAPVGRSLLMGLRHTLFTRPIVCSDKTYSIESDPVVIDPINDDLTTYAQHPILLGWGVQISPDAGPELRQTVEQELGRLWLGCLH